MKPFIKAVNRRDTTPRKKVRHARQALAEVDVEQLSARLGSISAPFPEAETENLAVYLSLLMQWGQAMNLTGAANWCEALDNLAADSFYLAGFLETLPLAAEPLIMDPGAGAGLPGIPLRLVWRRGSYCMVESREKRAIFLSTVLARLSLPCTTVFRGRVEEFFHKNPGVRPDMVISRAFMPLPRVLDLFRAHTGPGALAVFMSNEKSNEHTAEKTDGQKEGWKFCAETPYDGPSGRRWFIAYCRN